MLKQCCQHLVNSQIDCKDDLPFFEMALGKLTEPVTSKWLFGRVATLQAHYYTQAMPEELLEALGMDWYEELKDFPAWAISNACRWWMSADNEKRRYKPVCGDISARAKTELGIASIIKLRLKQHA